MVGLAILWGGFVSLMVLSAWVQILENDRQKELAQREFIDSVGGEDSPWINPSLSTRTHVDVSSIPDLVRVYPQTQRTGAAPADVPSSRPPAESIVTDEITGLQPVTSPHNVTHNPSELWEDWLTQNDIYFPLEVPPKDITDDHGLRALNEAKYWIKKAIKAGVPQSRVQTEMFGVSKGGGGKSGRIRELYKELNHG